MEDFTAVWRRGHISVSGGGDIIKQIGYIENGIQQWKYLSTLFPERWAYKEEYGEAYRKKNILQLAYNFGDYKTAKEAAQGEWKPESNIERVKKTFARNHILFSLLYIIYYKGKRN